MVEFGFIVLLLVALLLAVLSMPSVRHRRQPQTNAVTRAWIFLILFIYLAVWVAAIWMAPIRNDLVALPALFTALFVIVAFVMFWRLSRPNVFDARAYKTRADWGSVAVVQLLVVAIAAFILSMLQMFFDGA